MPITILDLSRHGLRICGTGSYKAGDTVVVELAAPCSSLRLEARVVWNDHARKRLAGVAFSELSKADTLALNAMLFEARRAATRIDDDVLLVTDDPDAQLRIAERIWALQYEVAARVTPEGALVYLEQHAARARAALISARLAGRAGQELLDRIAVLHPGVRRVLLVDNLADAANTFGESMPHFVLLSPFPSSELEVALRRTTA